jgi:hypothetical protein
MVGATARIASQARRNPATVRRWRDEPGRSHGWRVPSGHGEAALDASTLWWGLLFGSIGLGYFVYGRKQRAIVPLVCGIALMLFPYVVSGTTWIVVIGVALMLVPRFARI